jgi:hypothetical protein
MQPLEPGYAFFVQAYVDDYAKGELSATTDRGV